MGSLSGASECLAKLSRPETAGLIPRPRLFRRLDHACVRGAAWVYAPSGSGKTSLLATWAEACGRAPIWYRADEDDSDAATLVHYLRQLASAHAPGTPPLPALTPEYLVGLGTFARRFLRDLYARLPAPFVLVVDDVHQINADSPSLQLLSIALSEVPPGSAVVLCGRAAPPPVLARFALHEGALTWEDLKLDAAEATALLERIGSGRARDVEALRRVTQGWVAGFTLLASGRGEISTEGRTLTPDSGDALFAYFSHEVLAGCDASERAFLIATAPLATFTLAQAQALTGREDAEEVLETLRCGQFFVTRLSGEPPTYRCHPLFHEFLRHEARRALPEREWLTLRLQASGLAEGAGDVETAAALCIEARVWANLTALLRGAAPALVAQGRHALVQQWIGQVPSDVLDTSAWQLYWLGTAQLYTGQMRHGRAILERAMQGSSQRTSETGCCSPGAGSSRATTSSGTMSRRSPPGPAGSRGRFPRIWERCRHLWWRGF